MEKGSGKKGFDFGRFLFGCFVLSFLSFFAWSFGRDFFPEAFDRGTPVPCRIEASKVDAEKIDRFVLKVSFSYVYGGRRYVSDSLRRKGIGEFVFRRLAERRPLLERYAPGKTLTCRVDPGDPGQGVLPVAAPFQDGGGGADVLSRVIPLTFLSLFFGVGIFLAATSFPAVRRLATPRLGKLSMAALMILFSLPFTVAGTLAVRSALRDRASVRRYVPVPAKVLYAGILSHLSGGKRRSTTYSVRVGYEYVVDGRTYESDRFSAVEISTSGREGHLRKAGAYKAGQSVTAYVSPDDPRRSVLVRSGPLEAWFPVAGMGVFALVGMGIMAGGIGLFVSAFKRREAPPSFDARPLACSSAVLPGLGFFALVWNLVTGFMLGGLFAGGVFESFEPVFLVFALFPLFGIGLVVAFFRRLAFERRAPRLAMTLSCPVWEPGGAAQIDWKLEKAEAVESLEIALEGARWTGGKPRRKLVVSDTVCCRYENRTVPPGWRFGFTVPDRLPGVKWSFVVDLKADGIRKPIRCFFDLPAFEEQDAASGLAR